MFFCGKKVGYFALYVRGQKDENVGYIKICGGYERIQIEVRIQCRRIEDGKYALNLIGEQRKYQVAMIRIKEGRGIYESEYDSQKSLFQAEESQIEIESLKAACIEIDEELAIEARWKEWDAELSKADYPGVLEEKPFCPSGEDFFPDKWTQLVNSFETICPFGDDRQFVSIAPKDFIILREDYQKLVHNSFLLHGYYNYRHLILGKAGRIGREDEKCFYLGVPGAFYEREKMVAVMFGFEGFECEGPVETGRFGYYMRRVEI